jgi:hypothetical protein
MENIRGCIQKLPDWVDNEVYAYNNNTRWEATQRIMAAELTRLTHKIAIQLHLVAKSCTIHSRRPVRKIWIHPRSTESEITLLVFLQILTAPKKFSNKVYICSVMIFPTIIQPFPEELWRLEVFTTMKDEAGFFRVVRLCSYMVWYHSFRGSCCIHLTSVKSGYTVLN